MSVGHSELSSLSFNVFFNENFKQCKILLHFFLAVLSLRCCMLAFPRWSEWRLLWLRRSGFSLWSLLLLWSTGHRRGGFSSVSTWAQQCRRKLCPLHWQVDPQSLDHQGSPNMSFKYWCLIAQKPFSLRGGFHAPPLSHILTPQWDGIIIVAVVIILVNIA